jgi:hypothetical protein
LIAEMLLRSQSIEKSPLDKSRRTTQGEIHKAGVPEDRDRGLRYSGWLWTTE